MNENYVDIINLEYPLTVGQTRRLYRQTKLDSDMGRAAQFAPFAALQGYDEAIRRTASKVAVVSE
jgi:hypothetical protein